MPELLVDHQSCTSCGQCAAVCPVNIVRIPDGEYPRYVADGASRCILCGHCEAVCPAGAMLLDDPRLDPARYAPEDSRIDPALLGNYLRMRRSVRLYRDTPVPRPVIERIMDVVRYAPSGTNSQTVRWLIIHDTGELRRLTGLVVDWMRQMKLSDSPLNSYFNFEGMIRAWDKGKDPVCRNAPHLIVACSHKDSRSAGVDGIIALSCLDMLAPAYGVGTCWCGFFQYAASQYEPLRKAMGLEEEVVPVYAMMFGYPAVKYRRPPGRNPVSIVWR